MSAYARALPQQIAQHLEIMNQRANGVLASLERATRSLEDPAGSRGAIQVAVAEEPSPNLDGGHPNERSLSAGYSHARVKSLEIPLVQGW